MTVRFFALLNRARHLPGLLLIACALAVSGCVSAPEINHAVDRLKPATAEEVKTRRTLLVGTWYGEALTSEGQTRRWLRRNKVNGDYELTVRDYNLDGTYLEQVEVGNWGISGPVYFTMMKGWRDGRAFKAADTSDPYFYDAYEVVSVSEDRWAYQHKETQSRFYVKRVDEDFSLPGTPSKSSATKTASAQAHPGTTGNQRKR